MLKFSNPRLTAEFSDWPLGGNKRGKCVFQVHREKRGWRVSRQTTGKPKYTTYSGQACIVDGDNGRTYILQVAQGYGFIKVYRSDFMCASSDMGRNSGVFESDSPELHKELASLIVQSGAALQNVA